MKGQPEGRGYQRPNPLQRQTSRYDTDGGFIQENRQTAFQPFKLLTIDLSVAPGAANSPYQNGVNQLASNPGFPNPFVKFPYYGRGFNGFGFTTASGVGGTGLKTVVGTAIVAACIKDPAQSDIWWLKHNRGFRGEFGELWLSWIAQASNSMDVYIFAYDDLMAMSGEAAT